MQQIRSKIPNALTIARMLIAASIGVTLFVDVPILWVQILAVTGILSDKLDGTLARAWGVETELGKKMESVADPLFNTAMGIYLLLKLDFPMVFFWIGIGLFSVTILGRLVAQLITKKFFYEKSPITRYGTVSLYVIIVMYLFTLPYRFEVVVVVWIYGVVVMLNYLRMIVRGIQKEQREKSAALK